MSRLATLTRGFSLRWRFMVPPLLGLILLGLLTLAFIYEIQNQNALLTRVAEQDLQGYDRYSQVFIDLSEQHLALYRLLYDAQSLDEATLYDHGKQRLNQIFEAILALEQAVPTDIAGQSEADADFAALRRELLARTREYRRAATSAVEMASVNLALAPRYLTRANALFTTMHRAFVKVLDFERRNVKAEIASRVQQGEVGGRIIALAGIVAAMLLLVLSFLLARLLSRSLEAQINTLVDLGVRAGAPFAVEGTDEVDRIAQAITAFEQSLLRLRDQEQELVSANHTLTATLEALRQARDELEQRVQDRTRELQEKNEALLSEIERRQEAEEHLRIYEEVIRSTGEAVVITGLAGEIIEVNPAYEHAIGRAREELIGRRLYEENRNGETEEFSRQLWHALQADGHWTGEILDRRSNGELFPSWVLINAVRDEQGNPVHYVCVSRDITALKQSEQQLKQLAFYDSLTRLPNRALFHDRLHVAIASAERQQTMLGVMCLDLDHFKYVNDTLGHAAGDRLLAEIGQRLSHCARASDTVARMGGDEFMVLLTHLDSGDVAMRVADRIIKAVSTPIQLGDETVYVGTSLGISFYPKDGRDAVTIQKHADLAMYEAKEGGRSQYRVFSPDMLAKGNRRLSLSVQLDSALHNGEFTLFYQPIIKEATGQVDIVEALLRWQKPGGELVPAGEFIPHAEETGLIKRIDSWVLERACCDAVSWQRSSGRRLSICVNLSAVSVQQPSMASIIADILQRTAMPPELLNLEITETAVISTSYTAQKVLQEIVALGVNLSIDDFGVSHSSLSYLTRFPINCIKLDRLFVDRIGKDKTSKEIIKSLIELARKLGLRVVAEGVEQQDQQSFLAGVGCEFMQGFHFAKPMSGAGLREWLARRNDVSPAEPPRM